MLPNDWNKLREDDRSIRASLEQPAHVPPTPPGADFGRLPVAESSSVFDRASAWLLANYKWLAERAGLLAFYLAAPFSFYFAAQEATWLASIIAFFLISILAVLAATSTCLAGSVLVARLLEHKWKAAFVFCFISSLALIGIL